ncbi:MAG: hypothetical protein M1827_007578 [Pycnora praestabilis]|nr:MAG: hypothetical protein M1827_007578 [Pycnora praestabilis]
MGLLAPIAGDGKPDATVECQIVIAALRIMKLAITTDRVQAADSLLSRLRDGNDTDRLRILEDHFNDGTSHAKRKRSSSVSERVHESPRPRSEPLPEDELAEPFDETSVGKDGRICFYGTTSLFHFQPEHSASLLPDHGGTLDDFARTSRMASWAGLSGQGDNVISVTPSPPSIASVPTDIGTFLDADISSELGNELLETYWCWPHHLHLVLSRRIFMRDMITSGPYFTPFLLYTVLAQAARYSDRPEASKLGQRFAQRTLSLLAAEVDKGSSIPTIQALLIFSARECACGRTSQGWLYSGMAFRMMRDMGIHIHPDKMGHLVQQFTPEELALRQQVFWSCYTWDKTISLCLGRAPTIHDNMPVPVSDAILDGEEAENEPWRPKFATSSILNVGASQRSHTNSRFVAYCQLCKIIDDVLGTLYSKPHSAQQHLYDFLDRCIQRLEEWAHRLPSHLSIRVESRASSCPPLHILLLKLLYNAITILLCRPYRSTRPRAREMATAAAEEIDRLFMLHIRRFGFRVITYLESYTMFVASTINLLDLKEGIDEESASARLTLSLEILRNATSTPSNARCVEIIEQLLNKDKETPKDDTLMGQSQIQDHQPGSKSDGSNPATVTPSPLQQFQQSHPRTPVSPPTTGLPQADTYEFFKMAETDISSLFGPTKGHPNGGSTNKNPPMDMTAQLISPIDPPPISWLGEDGIGDGPGWMTMDMDFTQGSSVSSGVDALSSWGVNTPHLLTG